MRADKETVLIALQAEVTAVHNQFRPLINARLYKPLYIGFGGGGDNWAKINIIAGRVGSAFAAEIGTMQVTEQIDALQLLKTDPVDYLVIPRVIACALMLPLLTILSFITGMTGGLVITTTMFNISQTVFLDSARVFMSVWDLVSAMIKAVVFGGLIAIIGSSWGLTTTGGAKGVGQSTTTAVVTALLAIFITNFFLSWLMFQSSALNF